MAAPVITCLGGDYYTDPGVGIVVIQRTGSHHPRSQLVKTLVLYLYCWQGITKVIVLARTDGRIKSESGEHYLGSSWGSNFSSRVVRVHRWHAIHLGAQQSPMNHVVS